MPSQQIILIRKLKIQVNDPVAANVNAKTRFTPAKIKHNHPRGVRLLNFLLGVGFAVILIPWYFKLIF